MRSRELDTMTLTDPFQLEIFYDCDSLAAQSVLKVDIGIPKIICFAT